MKFTLLIYITVIALSALLTGCGGGGNDADRANDNAVGKSKPRTLPATDASNPTASPLDSWVGRWTGPEGTFLMLAKDGDLYRVEIKSLDGRAGYEGRPVGDHIEFERDGKTESIRATSGKDTGMKWLQDKTTCLTINPGEAFCRD